MGITMYIPNKRVFRLIRHYTDRWGEKKKRTIGTYTSMEKASAKLMSKLIEIAKSNIREAVTVKGAIRGRGVATIHNLCDEVESHGLKIETIHIDE